MRFAAGGRDFELDERAFELRCAGERVPLERKPLEVLLYLARHAERVVPREELLAALWPATAVGDGSLTRAVYALRRSAVGDGVIRTARGRGYRFTARCDESPRLHLDGAPEDVAVAIELGEHEMVSGRIEAGQPRLRRAFEAALASGDGEAAARAALAYASPEETPYLDEDRVAVLERGLAALPPADGALRALLQARLALALYFHPDAARRERLSRGASDMARRTGDLRARCYTLNWQRGALWSPESLEERFALGREMLPLAEQLGDPFALHEVRVFSIADALEAGDRERLDLETRAHARLAEKLPYPPFRWYVHHHRVTRALLEGRLADAEAELAAATAIGERTGFPLAGQWAAVQTFGLRRAQGRMAELAPVLHAYGAQFPLTPWGIVAARAELERGVTANARARLERELSGSPPGGRHTHTWPIAMLFLVEIAERLRARDWAEVLYRELEPFAGRQVTVGLGILYLGSVSRLLGVTARLAKREREAARHFARAEREERALGVV